MSWCQGRSLTRLQQFASNVLKCGSIPQHVAFIVDGNRRYAKRNGITREEGHKRGFDKIKELTFWVSKMGIREVTIYLFSIENFKRTEEEVKALLELIKGEFEDLLENLPEFQEYGICIRMLGKLDLLPEDVRKAAVLAAYLTRKNKKLVVNFAFSYTAREEMTNAVKSVVDGVRSGLLEIVDINEDLLSRCMYTSRSQDPEVLVRTGGDSRFSDFLLWQILNTKIYFEEVTWPDFSFWHLLKVIFNYQRSCGGIQKDVLKFECEEPSERREIFLKKLYRTRKEFLERHTYK